MQARDWSTFLLPAAVLAAPAYGADYVSVAQAQALLFPAAKSFIERPLVLDDAQREQVKAASGLRQRWPEQKVWRAESDGRLQGWFLIDEVIGKHEFITYAAAISPDGRVLGVEIMSYRETHGGQVREAAWRRHLVGKTLADPFKLDEDVPNISGATLSCRNVMDGVRRLLTLHKLFLAHG
ncbi:MAG TPA: FMN-binding protein [Burkholderiaceae bacterium]|nr:FMN-binding protein [Burkholderiaceae bacterium]